MLNTLLGGLAVGLVTTIIAFVAAVALQGFWQRAGFFRLLGSAVVIAACYYWFFASQSRGAVDVAGLCVLVGTLAIWNVIVLKFVAHWKTPTKTKTK